MTEVPRLAQSPNQSPNQPLVSIIVPAFNAQEYLAETIDSVIAQTYRPLEIIVVDDGSTDATAEVVRRFSGVVLIQQTNAGPAAARNAAIGVNRADLLQRQKAAPAERLALALTRKRFANENDIAWRCRTIGFEEGVIIRSTLGRMIMAPALIASREEVDELIGKTLKAVDRTAREFGRL
mgnify:CR=1 FL=1